MGKTFLGTLSLGLTMEPRKKQQYKALKSKLQTQAKKYIIVQFQLDLTIR
jgi:hypothetical protein